MIEFSFDEFPERPAYTNMGSTLTYSDLDKLSMQFACYLQKSLGLQRGERVAIMLPNVLQYPVVLVGIFRAGLVAVLGAGRPGPSFALHSRQRAKTIV